jgi:hypothetical protein
MLKSSSLALITTGALAVSSTALAGTGPFDTKSSGVINVAVYGDSPYGTTPTDTSETDATPAFIDSINANPTVSLVLHVGDIHSGKQFCTEAYDQEIYNLWTGFIRPLVYTPGDNEWTDCNKKGEGGGLYNSSTQMIDYVLDPVTHQPVDYAKGDPVANLSLIRSIFFPNPGFTLGDRKIVLSQAQVPNSAHPANQNYVENVMWEQSKVLFVTINLPGGSNNDQDVWYVAPTETAAQAQERNDRTQADLDWLDAAFAQASNDGVKAMVIGLQADLWDGACPTDVAHLSGYDPFVNNIASHTLAFGKPVLLFNGDSHVYRSDNPLAANDPHNCLHAGHDVPNFHRVIVHGSTFPLEWLKLTIDPRANAANSANAYGPFSWTRMIQQ